MSITPEKNKRLANAMKYDFGDILPLTKALNGDCKKNEQTVEDNQSKVITDVIHIKPPFIQDTLWIAFQKMFPWLYHSGNRFLCSFCEEGFKKNQGMVSSSWTGGGNYTRTITESTKGYNISRTRFERHGQTHNHILASELLLLSAPKDDWSNLKLKYLWLEGGINNTRCTICEDAYKNYKQSMIVTVWTCPDIMNHKPQSHFNTAHRLDRHEKCKNHQLAVKLMEGTVSRISHVNGPGSPIKTPLTKSNRSSNIRNSSVTRLLSRHTRLSLATTPCTPDPIALPPATIRRSRKSAPVKSCKQSEVLLPRIITPQQFHTLKSRFPWLTYHDETSFACEMCHSQEPQITFNVDATLSQISKKIITHVHTNVSEDRQGRSTRLQMGVSPKIDYKRLSTGSESVTQEKADVGSWSCPQCKSQFVHKAGLVAHISLCDYQSTDVARELSCPCGSLEHRFHTITKLDLHVAQDHGNQLLFHCYICSDRCSRLLTLYEHMIIHHLIDWDPFDTYMPVIPPSPSSECIFCKTSHMTNLEMTSHYCDSTCYKYLQAIVLLEDIYNYNKSPENNVVSQKSNFLGKPSRKKNSRTTFSQKMSKMSASRCGKKTKDISYMECLESNETSNETSAISLGNPIILKGNESDGPLYAKNDMINDKSTDICSTDVKSDFFNNNTDTSKDITLEKCAKLLPVDVNLERDATSNKVYETSEEGNITCTKSTDEHLKINKKEHEIDYIKESTKTIAENHVDIKNFVSQSNLNVPTETMEEHHANIEQNSSQRCVKMYTTNAKAPNEDDDELMQNSFQISAEMTTDNFETLDDDLDEIKQEALGKHTASKTEKSPGDHAKSKQKSSMKHADILIDSPFDKKSHEECQDIPLSSCKKTEDKHYIRKEISTESQSNYSETFPENQLNMKSPKKRVKISSDFEITEGECIQKKKSIESDSIISKENVKIRTNYSDLSVGSQRNKKSPLKFAEMAPSSIEASPHKRKEEAIKIFTELHPYNYEETVSEHIEFQNNLDMSLQGKCTVKFGNDLENNLASSTEIFPQNKHVTVVLEKLSVHAFSALVPVEMKKRIRMPSEKLKENADFMALSLENKKRIRFPSDKLKESRDSVTLSQENKKRVRFPSLKMRKVTNESDELDQEKNLLTPLEKMKESIDLKEKKRSKKRVKHVKVLKDETTENPSLCKDTELSGRKSSVHQRLTKNNSLHEKRKYKTEKVGLRIKRMRSPNKEPRGYVQKINQAMKRSLKFANRMKKSNVCTSSKDGKEQIVKADTKYVKITVKSEDTDNDNLRSSISDHHPTRHSIKKPRGLTIGVTDSDHSYQQPETPKSKRPIIIQSQLSPPAKVLINFVPDDDCLPIELSFMDRMKKIRQLKKIRTEQQREQMMAVDKTVAEINEKANGVSTLLKSEKIKKLLTSEQYSMHDLKSILHKESKKRKLSYHSVDQAPKKRKLSSLKAAKLETFVCDVCQIKFRSLRARDSHVTIEHKGAKIFKCKTCDVSRTTHFALRKHALKYHVDNVSFAVFGDDNHTVDFSFQCHFCPLQFTSKSGMNHHVTSIHRSDPEKHRSTQLDSATLLSTVDKFVDKLKQASPSHSPHECPMCDDMMANGFELALHIIEHEREQDCHIEANQFACPKCCRLFFGKEGKMYLKDHYNIIHLQKPLPSCDDCKTEFTSTWCYYEHKSSAKNCQKRSAEQLSIVDPYEPLNELLKLAFVCSRCQTLVAGEGACERFEEHQVACSQQLAEETEGPYPADTVQ